jgi:two-component system, NtrC family, response regulator AtoC
MVKKSRPADDDTFPDDEPTYAIGDRARQRGREPRAPQVSLVLYGRDGAQVVGLEGGRPLVVGRAAPADLVVDDPTLSRAHARFTLLDDGSVEVRDLGSTNGTEVRGETVEAARVGAGDRIILGSVVASVHVVRGASGQPTAIEGHDRFVDRLEHEVARARAFRRPAAVLMVRALGSGARHVSQWLPRVRAGMRPVDLVALYGTESALFALPETDGTAAARWAERMVGERRPGEPPLAFGVAAFPEAGASAEELIEAARTAALEASSETPVRAAAQAGAPASELLIVGEAMRRVDRLIDRVAAADIPVLLHGETGTGKEVVARALHARSRRAEGPMQTVNCGAIPPTLLESTLFGHDKGAFTGADQARAGLFEQADGGTVFLDEVGELSASAQAALLRVLETRRVTRVGSTRERELDVRVVAATHRDLEAMCDEGTFRWDLLFRLNTMVITVPALRERTEEVGPLAQRFLAAAAAAHGREVREIAPEAMALLEGYGWPGNVRELRNAIERAVVVADGPVLQPQDLSERIRGGGPGAPSPGAQGASATLAGDPGEGVPFRDRVRQFERQLMVDALERCGGNQSEAARRLGMPRRTFVSKVREYGLGDDDGSAGG